MAFLGVYGHVNIDHILIVPKIPTPDHTVPVQKELIRLGGTGGNIARGAAGLGVPTALASFIGSDFPPHLRDQLASSPLDLVDLRTLPGSSSRVWILSVPGGPQSSIIHQGVMADGEQRPRLDYTMLNSEWVHFATGPVPEFLDLAKEAHMIGKRVGFDPGRELAYRYDDRSFERFLDQSDVFFCNEEELRIGLEKLGYGEPKQFLDHTKAVVVTRRDQGARVYTEKHRIDVPACPLRNAVVPEGTGAGDAFRAGFYFGEWKKHPLEECVRFAAVAAGLFLETDGARFPRPEEVEARRQEWRT